MKYDSWKIKSRHPKSLIEAIIANRGIKDPEKFINADYKQLSSTDLLLNLPQAALRITKAIKNKERIGLFCDYDADGVCGGAIIYRAIKQKGLEVFEYVPERKEGYGLSQQAVDYFTDKKISLLITVDCGIKNINQIRELKENGIDAIVVDHHIIDEQLPEAIIIHPALTRDKSNLELSGGGTAYMLARVLLGEAGKWLIDLAAISSVADVVPLNRDNRILVKYGMIVLQKTKNPGLKSLLEVSGLQNKTLSSYDLGFALAPRLNAAGRIAHPVDSFNLLAKNISCDEIAGKLNKLNLKRQEMLTKAVAEAIKMVEQSEKYKNNLILIKGEWDEGIVGLIASKICERYYKPTIVLSIGDILKGSARSIEKINVTSLISKAESALLSYGGHAQAAGLSLEKRNFDLLEKKLLAEAKKIKKDEFIRTLNVDALISFDRLSLEEAQEIEKLSPFGQGNPRPIFALEKVRVTDFQIIGKDQNHKKVQFDCSGQQGSLLLFNFASKKIDVELEDVVDIAFTVSINEFRGNKKIDLIVEDVKKSE